MTTLNSPKKTLLFLCTGNSARSQMAEVLLRSKAEKLFDVYSAGTHPEGVDERTLTALTKYGLPTTNLTSKSIDTFSGVSFDYVITLCDNASNECRSHPGAKKQLAWDFPDPKKMTDLDAFAVTLHYLDKRLALFLALEVKSNLNESQFTKDTVTEALATTGEEHSVNIDPVSFYKCLTDDIRLKTLMLTNYHGELCVCELMAALSEESQPKVSRNLAVLKKAQLLTGRKHGQWIFYRINPALPLWVKNVIAQTTENNVSLIQASNTQLSVMCNRPNKVSFCD
ncbi:hypothetical protein GCM10009111_15150 [Colwellia asteriadis]|uniref:HTH arsR-type domain-containing protein n=1 Tax=Colwellia asteriadis TaxID=517723 RepID=A0ABN1L6D8_9GAMM